MMKIALMFSVVLFVAGDDAAVHRLTSDGLPKIRPSWSPDGRWLAFARMEEGGAQIRQYVLDTKGTATARRLTDRTDPEYHGVFAPDGSRLLLTLVPRSGTQGNCDLAVIGADGTGLEVVVGDRDGALSHQEWPSWSPDGDRFAFSSTHDGNQEVYTARSDGSDLVRLSQSPGIDAHPCWSPEGDRIVFTTDRWGGLELASVRPDGTGLTRLTESPGLDDHPAVSPDGRRIAFVSHRDGQFEVYVMAIDGSKVVNISRWPGRDTMPTWTPDGTGLTFVSDRNGGSDVYTARVEMGEGP